MYQKLHTQYPCLKQGKYGGIILFTAPNTGTKLTHATKPIPKNNDGYNLPIGHTCNDWVDNQREWLETKKEVILWFDNDEAGRNGVEKAINRLKLIKGLKISVVNNKFWKDANEVLVNEGINSIIESIEECKEKNDTGVIDITQIARFDLNSIERFLTGIKGLDLMLRGFKETEAIVIAGDNASGKTTFVGQVVLNAIEQNKKVFMYNGVHHAKDTSKEV